MGRLTRVATLREADRPNLEPYVRASRRAAVAMGFELQSHPVGNLADLDAAFTTISRNRPDALSVGGSGITFSHRARVIEFAVQQKLPAIYGNRLSVTEGGLMSYTADNNAIALRVATMIHQAL